MMYEEDEKKDEKIEIEVVTGDGSEIDVSEVSDHLNAVRPKTKEDEKPTQNIIIPEVNKKE